MAACLSMRCSLYSCRMMPIVPRTSTPLLWATLRRLPSPVHRVADSSDARCSTDTSVKDRLYLSFDCFRSFWSSMTTVYCSSTSYECTIRDGSRFLTSSRFGFFSSIMTKDVVCTCTLAFWMMCNRPILCRSMIMFAS